MGTTNNTCDPGRITKLSKNLDTPHIKEQGAIDVSAVRDEITSVMEGGERAFRLRKEKYGF